MPRMDSPDGQPDPEASARAEPIPQAVPVARPVQGYGAELPSVPLVDCDMLIPGSSRGGAIGDIALVALIFLVLQTVAGVLILALGVASEEPAVRERAMIIPMLPVMALASFVAVGLVLKRRRQGWRSIGLRGGQLWLDGAIGIGAAIATPIVILLSLVALQNIFPQLAGQMEENTERIMEMFPNIGPAGFVMVATLVGIYEETLFRGFLMTRLRRATGSWTGGVLLSTLVFVALHATHQTFSALIAITILSLSFSLLTIWRRSIVPAIIAHTLFDLAQFLILYYTAGDAWT